MANPVEDEETTEKMIIDEIDAMEEVDNNDEIANNEIENPEIAKSS